MSTKFSWKALLAIVKGADSMSLDNDLEYIDVYAYNVTDDGFDIMTPNSGKVNYSIRRGTNKEVEVDGTGVWLWPDGHDEEVQISVYKAWQLEDDPELLKIMADEKAAEEETERQKSFRYRDQFVKGAKFRVIKEGAHISGTKPTAPWTSGGYGEKLEVGRVIMCAGEGMTQGDGVPAIKWQNEDGSYICNDALFSPVTGGMWGGQVPEPGFLELVTTPTPK